MEQVTPRKAEVIGVISGIAGVLALNEVWKDIFMEGNFDLGSAGLTAIGALAIGAAKYHFDSHDSQPN